MQDNIGAFTSILGGGQLQHRRKWKHVVSDPGCDVTDFAELTDRVAELTFHNPGLNLFFRGQTSNFPGKGGVNGPKFDLATSLLPSAYREPVSPDMQRSREHFKRLKDMTADARERLKHLHHEIEELDQFDHVVWAVLQHYGCETPLLDITQSLHVASCFAVYDYDKRTSAANGYVYVLGLPNINGHFSYFAHEGMVMVKLQAACPPQAKRPHYQQGYLVGSMPSGPKPHWYHLRNLVLRLVAKFRILSLSSFWTPGYSLIPPEVMMQDDDVAKMVAEIKARCT